MTFLEDGTGDGVTWTQRDLEREARRVAAQLRASVGPGARVLLMAAPGLDYLAGFFGCMYAGTIAVPAYPPSPMHGKANMDRLQAVAESADVTVGLTTDSLLPTLEGFAVAGRLTEWISISRDAPDPDLSEPLPPLNRGDIAFLQYTSGSTGDPKGVMVTQGNLVDNALMIGTTYEMNAGSTVVSWLPPYHDMGLIGTLLTPIVLGLHAIFMPPAVFLRRPVRWLQVLSRTRGYVVSPAPNFAYEACIEKIKDADLAGLDLSSWKVAINGAEPVRAATVERFIERFGPYGFSPTAMRPSYGLAETTLMTAAAGPAGPRVLDVDADALEKGNLLLVAGTQGGQRVVSSGFPPAGAEVRIIDPGTGAALADGQIGEIEVSGPHVTQGYWRRPEVSADRFVGGTVRTGDLGCLFEGELVVTGRIKDILIIRGRNYYPHDIEATVEDAHTSFRRGCGAAFTVTEDDRELLVVVQEVNLGLLGEPAAVVEMIRRSITATHGVNASAVVLIRQGTVPKTSSGKIRRSDTRQLYQDDALDSLWSWRAGHPVEVVGAEAR